MVLKSRKTKQIIAITIIAALALMSVQAAFASEHPVTTSAAVDVPDISVIVGATGYKVPGASVYINDKLVGKTDGKGNLTLSEPVTGSNVAVKVVRSGFNDTTVITDFKQKPVVVSVGQAKYTAKLTLHVTDATTKGDLAGTTIYNGDYKLGTTDANGDLVIDGFPMGFYLIKIEKDGYKTTNTLLLFFSASTQKYSLKPGADATKPEH